MFCDNLLINIADFKQTDIKQMEKSFSFTVLDVGIEFLAQNRCRHDEGTQSKMFPM